MKPMACDGIIIPPLVSKKAFRPVLITLKCETNNTIELNCGRVAGLMNHTIVWYSN